MLQEAYLETPHGRLNTARGPKNGPLLLLLHGFTNRWQTFLPFLPSLTQHWQVLAFDHRGHGHSEHIPGTYTAAGFYADAEAMLLHIDAPALLLGHSMGGSLALHLAQNYPDRIRGVVTGDTSLNLRLHIEVMNNRRNTKLFGLRRKLAGRPLDELIRRGLSPQQAEEMWLLDPHVMDSHAEGQVAGFFEDISDVDLDKICCPLLITQANPQKGGLLLDEEITPVLQAHPHFHFKHFDCGHDLDIDKGTQSAFFIAALEFLQTLETK